MNGDFANQFLGILFNFGYFPFNDTNSHEQFCSKYSKTISEFRLGLNLVLRFFVEPISG